MTRHLIALGMAASLAAAGELVFPAAVERDGLVNGVYRIGRKTTGKGELAIRWTDVYGRVIQDRKIPVDLDGRTEIAFSIDARRAVAMKNRLEAQLSGDASGKAQATFIARPRDRTWWDYHILMWPYRSTDELAKLKGIGVDGGEYLWKDRPAPDFLLDNDLRWYVENMATDFYSEYHRWHADREPNWQFHDVKARHAQDPGSLEPFRRDPSLSDAAWLGKIHDRLVEATRFWSPYRPLFYSLGDETGIADLSAFWDFDFSDASLGGMRRWLEERYGSLAALNREWGTRFDRWDRVMPETTDQAMKHSDGNFSAWADHKEWMDVAYARALKMGADAIRSVDRDAYVGIGGAQAPGWGGYDYYRITQVLTAIEPYDLGNNVEIIRSLNPKMVVLTTASESGPREKRRVWSELLRGNRGLILWDDKRELAGNRGLEAAPYYSELRNGVGALLAASEQVADSIAIHYSQASMRVEWMLAQRPHGGEWVKRNASYETEDSEFRRVRERWCGAIEDLGLRYNFVAYGQVEQGELKRGGYRVLVLPRSSALSEAETRAIREFVQQGGTLLADGEPGTFDEHAKKLSRASLAELFAGQGAGKGRAIRVDSNRLVTLGKLLRESGVQPEFAITDETGKPVNGVEVRRFRNGGVTIVGLLANPQGNGAKAMRLRLNLPAELNAWNVRMGQALGRQKQVAVTLDPFEPAILAFSAQPIPELKIAAPSRVQRGTTVNIRPGFAGGSPVGLDVLHIEVVDPAGEHVAYYSGNQLGTGSWPAPLAMNDRTGMWRVRVRDVLTGRVESVSLEVR